MKLDRIIIGTDFSHASVAGARWTAHRFAPEAEVVLAHVVTVPEPPAFLRGRFASTDSLVTTAREGAEQRLRELAPSLGAGRVQIETRVGKPWEELAKLATEFDADAIAVGRHGARPGVWGRLGSTAEKLVRGAKVPVLLATGLHDAKLRHVLAAVDDSESAPAVASWVRYFAARDGVRVTALHVIASAVLDSVLAPVTAGAHGANDDEDDDGADVREDVRRDADRWVAGLLGAGLAPERVASEVAFGEAGQEILAAATRHDTDLIVTGSHGGSALRRLVVGSVASEVLRGAACPVLVVNVPEDEIVD
ncbi:MAG TPA: universal stress protein [Gemmatimonadaceae bacterium]|nr:universal stress protein [Gemmatimonadaceae bacterium]